MKTYLRIISFAKPYATFAVPYFIFALLSTIFGFINFAFLMPILDLLFSATKNFDELTKPEPALSIEYFKGILDYYTALLIRDYGKSTALVFIAAFLISTNFLTNGFKYVSQLVNIRMRNMVIYRLRERLFNKVVHLDVGYFTTQRKGDLMSRMTNDLSEIENSVVGTLEVFFRDPFTLIIYFAALLLIQWKLMVLTLLILPVAGIGVSIIG